MARELVDRRRFLHRLTTALVVTACGGVACIPEKNPPAATAREPSAKPRATYTMRDLAGRARNRREGITPGALEAEGDPPRRPIKRSDRKRETNS